LATPLVFRCFVSLTSYILITKEAKRGVNLDELPQLWSIIKGDMSIVEYPEKNCSGLI